MSAHSQYTQLQAIGVIGFLVLVLGPVLALLKIDSLGNGGGDKEAQQREVSMYSPLAGGHTRDERGQGAKWAPVHSAELASQHS